MSIVLQGSTSGSITLQEPAIAGSNTISLPAATGTAVLTGVSGNVDINAAGSNNVTLSTNSTERVRVDSSGNVGIGTTSPVTKLDVASGRVTIRGSGLFNTSSNDGTGSAAFIRSANAFSSATTPDYTWWYNDQCGIFHPAADVIGFSTGGTERMRITSGGFVNFPSGDFAGQLGTSASYGYWSNSNSTSFLQFNGATNANPFIIYARANTGGVQLNNGATAWSATSDARLKNVTGTYSNPLADIAQIEPVKFTWKDDADNKPQVGVLAQSVLPVVPEAVDSQKLLRSEDETEYLSVRYTELIPLMIASIQELKGIVDTQATKIAELEAKLEGTA